MTAPRRKWIGGLLLVAVIAAGAAWSRYDANWPGSRLMAWWPGSSAISSDPLQSAPASVPQRRSVAALGRIEPHSEVIDVGASSAGLLGALLVEEGQFVTLGETLGHLDSYQERIAERDEWAARLDEARAMLAAEIGLGEARIAAAEIRLRQVEEIYPLRLEAQEARIELLSVELANNRSILGQHQTLQQRAVGSRRTVDDQQTLVLKNEQEIEIARAELARLQAEQRLEALTAATELHLEQAALERARVAVGLGSSEKELALAEARAARTIIRAPIDGRVLKIVTWPGERVSDTPVLQLGDSRTMHVVAEVYETDIGLVRIGQAARIESPSLPNGMTGRVVQIGKLIFKNDVLDVDPAADADARVVEVRIELDDGALVENLTNMTVDVVIDVEQGETIASTPGPALR